MRFTLAFVAALLLASFTALHTAEPIRVLVWDEQQPQQKEGYGAQFLGETIAAHLAKQPGLSVKNAKLDDTEQGLSDAALDATDVLIFWCHRRVKDQDDARMEAVVKRVMEGKIGFIGLHSTHWGKPFVRLMQERADVAVAEQRPAKVNEVFQKLRRQTQGVKGADGLVTDAKMLGMPVVTEGDKHDVGLELTQNLGKGGTQRRQLAIELLFRQVECCRNHFVKNFHKLFLGH